VLYDVFMERKDATFARPKKANRWLADGSLDYRRVTKVTGRFVELRGQDPADISRPKGFDHVLIIPSHAIRSIAYYSPEAPAGASKRPITVLACGNVRAVCDCFDRNVEKPLAKTPRSWRGLRPQPKK
jgi:hypothetical protein